LKSSRCLLVKTSSVARGLLLPDIFKANAPFRLYYSQALNSQISDWNIAASNI
jgi:hypothetical protein